MTSKARAACAYSRTLDPLHPSARFTRPRHSGFMGRYSAVSRYSFTVRNARSKKRPCQNSPASRRRGRAAVEVSGGSDGQCASDRGFFNIKNPRLEQRQPWLPLRNGERAGREQDGVPMIGQEHPSRQQEAGRRGLHALHRRGVRSTGTTYSARRQPLLRMVQLPGHEPTHWTVSTNRTLGSVLRLG